MKIVQTSDIAGQHLRVAVIGTPWRIDAISVGQGQHIPLEDCRVDVRLLLITRFVLKAEERLVYIPGIVERQGPLNRRAHLFNEADRGFVAKLPAERLRRTDQVLNVALLDLRVLGIASAQRILSRT